jgi:hypothetical protein
MVLSRFDHFGKRQFEIVGDLHLLAHPDAQHARQMMSILAMKFGLLLRDPIDKE